MSHPYHPTPNEERKCSICAREHAELLASGAAWTCRPRPTEPNLRDIFRPDGTLMAGGFSPQLAHTIIAEMNRTQEVKP